MTTTSDADERIVPADWVPGPRQGQWTYDYYAALPDDGKRYEIIDGVLYMAPSPNVPHQSISIRLTFYLFPHVEIAGLGRVFSAPLDVELGPKVIVQPDVIVLLNSNLSRITEKRVTGAPDLAIEIASPGTSKYDRGVKQAVYARARVPEYWIVDPVKRTVQVSILEGEAYISRGIFSGKQTLPSRIVPDFNVPVELFFPT